jgi:S-adenosylmethionine hydrolase
MLASDSARVRDPVFNPCGIITLTTDFGDRDPFVATMKGRILDRLPSARIIDVTHQISTYWPAEAGFWLSRAYPYFPAGTVHIAVVDPGVGTSRHIVGVQVDDHIFLAPDNGLLSLVLRRAKASRIHRLDVKHALERFRLSTPSSTFHGRDLFAPIAAELAAGRATLEDIGPPTDSVLEVAVASTEQSADGIHGVVITVDHFGNLITDIDESLIRGLQRPAVTIDGRQIPLRRTYGDVQPGDLLALINSFGVVEIAVAQGSAAAVLGLSRGTPVSVRDA